MPSNGMMHAPPIAFVRTQTHPLVAIVGRASRPHVTWIIIRPHLCPLAGPHSPPRRPAFTPTRCVFVGTQLHPPDRMDGSISGPALLCDVFLRPETAQGHFLNFSRLLDFNNGRVPFASAQVGRALRNSPCAGLLRVREFTMVEIEHFVDPLDKSHPHFGEAAGQSTLKRMTVGQAVKEGSIANEMLGYFVAHIYQFLVKIGVDKARLRFRQHMANEMAHYATDCWDAEIQNSVGGWTECVGCTDRAAYDLSVHAAKTKQPLVVRQALKEPLIEERAVAEFDKKALGKMLKGEAGVVSGTVEALDEAGLIRLKGERRGDPATINVDSKEFTLQPSMLTIERKTFKTNVREFTPNVIEPSFGIGRILYCLLEHSFWSREQDVERGFGASISFVALLWAEPFAGVPHLAPTGLADMLYADQSGTTTLTSCPSRPLWPPTKVLIVPLSARAEFDPLVKEVSLRFRKAGVHTRVDDSNTSIGKRYARNDELGTPFGVTLDFAWNATRWISGGSIDNVIAAVTELVNGNIDWAEACQRLPAYDGIQAVD
ncbi:hypothetical protein B0H14DRAFT_3871996 [Mycena olivaceomarginata]|nr:hypothetical protein B0H14DRAFT_3871996 [Mycena olivaceomarginata]